MSHGLYVFTSEATLDKMTLSVEMLNRDWRLVYLTPDAFQPGITGAFLPDHGTLNGTLLLSGWPTDHRNANRFESLVAEQNYPAFAALATTSPGLPTCPLSVSPYDFRAEYDEDEAAEYLLGYAENLKQARLAARWQYDLTTSAGRAPSVLEFQQACWRAIAKLTHGLAEDPQDGQKFIGEPAANPTFLQKLWLKLITPNI